MYLMNCMVSLERFPGKGLKVLSGFFYLPIIKCKRERQAEEITIKYKGTRAYWV